MEWWQDHSLEHVHFLAQYFFLQALNPMVKDHGKLVALMLSPLPTSAVHDILSKEIENISKGGNSLYQIYGIIASCRICGLVLRVHWDVPWF